MPEEDCENIVLGCLRPPDFYALTGGVGHPRPHTGAYGIFPTLFYKEKYDFFYDWKLLKNKEVLFVEYVPWGENGKAAIVEAPPLA